MVARPVFLLAIGAFPGAGRDASALRSQTLLAVQWRLCLRAAWRAGRRINTPVQQPRTRLCRRRRRRATATAALHCAFQVGHCHYEVGRGPIRYICLIVNGARRRDTSGLFPPGADGYYLWSGCRITRRVVSFRTRHRAGEEEGGVFLSLSCFLFLYFL